MSAPARKPRPDAPAAAPPLSEPVASETPHLRPRAEREAGAAGAASGPGEVHRLQHRVARAFTSPGPNTLEATLMKLIILAAACLFLRTAIIAGGGFLAGLSH